ncbi:MULTISPECIES: phage major capsid protein [Bacillus cereus group]|uniref:phage major capsid protein n=1 Tax=Bacillus cereus group TaxID=86661 RepID=UPI000975A13F|nr:MULTISPECIES: phage major capsid protein [Bacillus cereus group]ONG78489.1 phage capsid protein [Bacillus cereus]MCR6791688.1 phage major capsid protein [Bacillus paranthracis]MDX6048374.1 phage major capsid protein [Bacillus paranthracis]MED1168982.1 phage major capsid protein [Bacillus paranthracis]MED1648000.1 phage major capsid protein [Bacillus pacificus]
MGKDLETKIENVQNLSEVLASGTPEQVDNALVQFAQGIQNEILQQAQIQSSDQAILAARGGRVLTSQETKYYNEVIAGNSFAGTEALVPPTVIERVFEDLVGSHELLSKINFVNVGALTEWILKKGDVQTAFWGKLCAAHKELLDEGFETINMNQYKLSAFMPVCKAMLDLGPVWLDRYVRTVLVESLKIALEVAIVRGTGKDQPIGMMKDLLNVTNGEHADKAVTATLKDLSPYTLGNIMALLTRDGKRNPEDVMLIVNPVDYWAKVYGYTTRPNADGTYAYNVLPIPGSFVKSNAVPKGKMVVGMAKDYFLGLGGAQRLDVYDQTRAIEDEDLYIAKMYANGRADRNDSFLVYDITGLVDPNAVTPPAGE